MEVERKIQKYPALKFKAIDVAVNPKTNKTYVANCFSVIDGQI
jgi:hypothetical protein